MARPPTPETIVATLTAPEKLALAAIHDGKYPHLGNADDDVAKLIGRRLIRRKADGSLRLSPRGRGVLVASFQAESRTQPFAIGRHVGRATLDAKGPASNPSDMGHQSTILGLPQTNSAQSPPVPPWFISQRAGGGVFGFAESVPASPPYVEPSYPHLRAAATALGLQIDTSQPTRAAVEALLNPDPAVEREIAESPFKEENGRDDAGDHQTAGHQVIRRRLLERPDDIRETARNLSDAFRNQANELRRSKPNEPGQLAQYESLLSFFEQMAAGLTDLADALDRAFSSATASPRPSPEPVLLGKAAQIARALQLRTQQWIEEMGTAVIDVPVRIGVLCAGIAFLHSIGADSLGAIAALGWLVRPRGEKKTARKPSNKKKSIG